MTNPVPLSRGEATPPWVLSVSMLWGKSEYIVHWKLDTSGSSTHCSIGSTRAGAIKQAEKDREGLIVRIATERMTA